MRASSLERSLKTGFVGFLFLIAVASLAGAQSETVARPEMIAQHVPFLTLQNRTGFDNPGRAYGDERSDLSAGPCAVRQIDLGGLTSLAAQAPQFIQEEFLRVDRIVDKPSTAIMDELQETTSESGPALYVHGYYISFEKGCRRAALFQKNADLDGRFLWFSWPSDGSLAYYSHDEADLYMKRARHCRCNHRDGSPFRQRCRRYRRT